MYIVLMSGGAGKRLWPLSNSVRPKQYIELVNEDSRKEKKCSMVQRVWKQLEHAKLTENTIITASRNQVDIIQHQLGSVNIAIEPERRDTFAAILLSCAYLKSSLDAKENDTVVVLPVDPYTEDRYFETVKQLEQILDTSNADIALMGVKPTYPAEKYGYILPKKNLDEYIEVKGFVEKPNKEIAEKLIEEGAIWNCGVFCFKLGMMVQKAREYDMELDYNLVYGNYTMLPRISFDYEVLEKNNNLVAISFDGLWKDLGTWDSLIEQMDEKNIGLVVNDNETRNTSVINVLNDIPVVTMGVKDTIIVASQDGILITSKKATSNIKDVTAELSSEPMCGQYSWGSVEVYRRESDSNNKVLIQQVKIREGRRINIHKHESVREIITILSGEVAVTIDGQDTKLHRGQIVSIDKMTDHSLTAISDVELIETQISNE